MGFGVGTLVSRAQKNVFREDLLHKDLKNMERNANAREKTLVENIYIPPWNQNHLHILDMEMKKYKGENILLIGYFNSRKKILDRNTNNNSRMGLILEDIINRHDF